MAILQRVFIKFDIAASLCFLSVAVLVLSYNRTSPLAKVKRVTRAKNQHLFLCCLPDGCNRYKNVRPADRSGERKLRQDGGDLPRQVRICERSAEMKAPVELLSNRAVLRSKMEGPRPDKLSSRCTECRQCKEKHGFPAGVQKVCKSVQSPRKKKIPRGILRFLVGFWCARGNSNPWPSD